MKPQYIRIDTDGDKFYYSDKEMQVYHREDGPAVEWSNGTREWVRNGVLHREDGPAIVYYTGSKYWYRNGKLHREDGPAVEWKDGTKYWYLDGVSLTSTQFKKTKKVSCNSKTTEKTKKSPCNGKKVTIDGVEYTLKA